MSHYTRSSSFEYVVDKMSCIKLTEMPPSSTCLNKRQRIEFNSVLPVHDVASGLIAVFKQLEACRHPLSNMWSIKWVALSWPKCHLLQLVLTNVKGLSLILFYQYTMLPLGWLPSSNSSKRAGFELVKNYTSIISYCSQLPSKFVWAEESYHSDYFCIKTVNMSVRRTYPISLY